MLPGSWKVLEFFCNRESGNSEMHCCRGGTVVNGVRSLQYTCHGRVLSAQPRDIFVIRCPGRRKFRAHNLAAVGGTVSCFFWGGGISPKMMPGINAGVGA